ncbi:hypothetical protein HPG69_003014 [Diceros bicornis minor]|uniref:Uncharacterized protein n=1 Tax=Diceros bicornis minor TaxID=77932 RepID=A0A7J7EJX3_DICBM|nr:hypothetical protein HPG69_003014 [Diceros bicornis minor]
MEVVVRPGDQSLDAGWLARRLSCSWCLSFALEAASAEGAGRGQLEAAESGVQVVWCVRIQPLDRPFPQRPEKSRPSSSVQPVVLDFLAILAYDSDAVLDHFPYPDPSQWTDEELGTLPVDEDGNHGLSSLQEAGLLFREQRLRGAVPGWRCLGWVMWSRQQVYHWTTDSPTLGP